MNLALYIANRVQKSGKGSFTRTVTQITIATAALGTTVMVLAYCILGGFKHNIREKVFSFSGHLTVSKYTLEHSPGKTPIRTDSALLGRFRALPHVAHVQPYAFLPALFSTDREVQGILFKGVGPAFNRQAFRDHLVAGKLWNPRDSLAQEQVMVSERIARMVQAEVGDTLLTAFLKERPSFRKLRIVGIYKTGLEEFDKNMVIGSLSLLQRINAWDSTQAVGVEVFADHYQNLDQVYGSLYEAKGMEHRVERVTQKYLQLFEWLKLLDTNVFILLRLILVITAFNMISTLLIMILERTPMIGTLKSLGATNWQIQKIFFWNGFSLIAKGLLIGNLLGFLLAALQYGTHAMPLDPVNYYMDHVPIAWQWQQVLVFNLLVLGLSALTLLLPTYLITRISPVRATRFA